MVVMDPVVPSKEVQMSEESARGRFVWHDLMTKDQEAAKAFYTTVVGWGTTTWQGDKGPYTMWTAGETPVGGIMTPPPEAAGDDFKPHWIAYVAVPDVDATAKRAQELGARIHVPPTPIPDVGSFSVLTDPQGATFAVYTSNNPTQPEPEETPNGEFSWHELATSDYKAAFAFYSDLFGWEKTSEMDMGPDGVYFMYGLRGRPYGGMYNKKPEHGAPAWLPYARVADVQGAAEKIREHGGQVDNGPMQVPGGSWIVMATDPQGGKFALHQLVAGTK